LTFKFFRSRKFIRCKSTFFKEDLIAWIGVFLDNDDDDDEKRKKAMMMRK
jgi:hypothetical protein